MSLQRHDLVCDWNTGHDWPRLLKEGLHPPGLCTKPATHVAFIGSLARPFCAVHAQHRVTGDRVEPLVRDPRVGVLVAFAIAGFSDEMLDLLIADVVAGVAGAEVLLLDYVEQSGMADPGYRVTFAGRTWIEVDDFERCADRRCQRRAGHPGMHMSRFGDGLSEIVDEWGDSQDLLDAYLYGAQAWRR